MYKNSKKKRKVIAIVAIVVIAAMVMTMLLSALAVPAAADEKETIRDNIYIGEVAVGGMDASQADAVVQSYMEEIADQKVVLTVGSRFVEATVEELGLSENIQEIVAEALEYGSVGNLIRRFKEQKDLEKNDQVLPLIMNVDEQKVREFLEEHLDELNQDAVDFGLTRENGAFRVIEGKDGIAVQVDESVRLLKEYFAKGWTGEDRIELASAVTKPLGSREELEAVKDVLGSFSTNYSTSASGRKTNVANGCTRINGSVVYPGQTFSVYEAVQPFTAENGYALAGSYENGTTVESYGGGICQVSTTLYNAVIRSELEIVERSGHSMLVSYVDPSADAAIAGTYKDLKFKNNTEAPIYIEGYSDGATLKFTIYGKETRPANRSVSFVSETTSTTEPTVEYRATSDPIGVFSQVQSSHTGKTARLWKVVTVDGVEQSREVFNNTTYRMSPTIYAVGTASSSSEATAAMKAAIASKDTATIKAAAAKWNAEALKQQEEEAKKNEEEAANNAAESHPGENEASDPVSDTAE